MAMPRAGRLPAARRVVSWWPPEGYLEVVVSFCDVLVAVVVLVGAGWSWSTWYSVTVR